MFCVRRHVKSGFLGGALVFPGGKVEASDAAERWALLATEPHPRATGLIEPDDDAPASTALDARTLAVAACRETFEEGGLLPIDGGIAASDLATLASAIRAGGGLADELERLGRRLALGALVPWARWITPAAESRRFDARFFLLEGPPGQVGRHDDHETTSSLWARPADVLDRAARGEFFLAPPTAHTLELLASVADVTGAVALAERQTLKPICPLFSPGDAAMPPFLALPGDPAHAIRERRAEGPTRYVLRDGRFVGEAAPLSARSTGDAGTHPMRPEE